MYRLDVMILYPNLVSSEDLNFVTNFTRVVNLFHEELFVSTLAPCHARAEHPPGSMYRELSIGLSPRSFAAPATASFQYRGEPLCPHRALPTL